jgi:hypothetical protein
MSQQEFDPREQRADAPYGQEGMPKDEPPGAYGAPSAQFEPRSHQRYRTRQAQVPHWARPQSQGFGRSGFVALMILLILIALGLGGLSIAGAILGAIAHLIGVIIGAIFGLFLFVLILLALALALIRRALGGGRYSRRRRPWY